MKNSDVDIEKEDKIIRGVAELGYIPIKVKQEKYNPEFVAVLARTDEADKYITFEYNHDKSMFRNRRSYDDELLAKTDFNLRADKFCQDSDENQDEFLVTVSEVRARDFMVQADSVEGACEVINDAYSNGDIFLEIEDFSSSDFKCRCKLSSEDF